MRLHSTASKKKGSTKNLHNWANEQRKQYHLKQQGPTKISTLTDDRLKRFNDVGFSCELHDDVWQEQFDMFKVQIKSSSDYQKLSDDNQKLRSWLYKQSLLYKKPNPM